MIIDDLYEFNDYNTDFYKTNDRDLDIVVSYALDELRGIGTDIIYQNNFDSGNLFNIGLCRINTEFVNMNLENILKLFVLNKAIKLLNKGVAVHEDLFSVTEDLPQLADQFIDNFTTEDLNYCENTIERKIKDLFKEGDI